MRLTRFSGFLLACFALVGTGWCGFFTVRQGSDGNWTLVDPNGQDFFARGVDHLRYEGFKDAESGRWNYKEANDAKFGGDREAWAKETLVRLKDWGFNTFGSGPSPELLHKGVYHTGFLGIGSFRDETEYRIPPRFPNVFHPDWEGFCDEMAKSECEASRDDPDLIGYFFGNELQWWGDGTGKEWKFGLFHSAAGLPDGHPAKQALLEYTGGLTDVSDEVKEGFVRLCAERYFSTVAAAIRKYDPNHLLLGCRFMGVPDGAALPAVWEACGKYCDVVSVNVYPHVDLATGEVLNSRLPDALRFRDVCRQVSAWAGRPLFISEWSFLATDAGLPCSVSSGTRYATQVERARAVATFLRELDECPFIVGTDFFMWVDEPAGGLADGAVGENGNYGLVNDRGEPYRALVDAFRCAGTYDDLNGAKWTADDYWNTSNRTSVAVSVDVSRSEAEVSSRVLKTWCFSSVANVCSLPFRGLMLMFR